MSSLALRKVHKRFGETVALAHLDLEIREGELVSLLGPSGCGKTTALRVVAGFEQPDEGEVEVAGLPVVNLPPHRRGMGMVFQAYSLFPHLSALDNVGFGLRMRGVGAGERGWRAMEMLDLVGLADRATAFPHELSGGQQQRVALARALAPRPSVLLLDEPLSALDAKVRLQLRGEIRRIQKETGITTLFVTHDQEEALALGDRVGVMSAGRLEQLASPADVYERPATAFVARFVGKMNELPGVVAGERAVRVEGVPIDGVRLDGRPEGSPVTLLARPEHLSLVAAGNGALPGRVVSVAFHGARSEVSVRVAGLQVVVDLPTAEVAGWAPDSPVGVEVNGSRAIVD